MHLSALKVSPFYPFCGIAAESAKPEKPARYKKQKAKHVDFTPLFRDCTATVMQSMSNSFGGGVALTVQLRYNSNIYKS